jgi:pyruvate, orthophosphate dikinase
VRALLIKGAATPEQLGEAMHAGSDRLEPLLATLEHEGLVEKGGGGLRLSAAGKLAALGLFTADRATVGEKRSVDILEEFHSFDQRMKDIVTAWQVRDVAGEQVLNDHSDAAYDAQVLSELAALHSDMEMWLAPLSGAMRRFAVYRVRLGRAAERARDGDQRFIASPRVDSYHSIWFELHEDLIRLAGRRRSDEASAGRA